MRCKVDLIFDLVKAPPFRVGQGVGCSVDPSFHRDIAFQIHLAHQSWEFSLPVLEPAFPEALLTPNNVAEGLLPSLYLRDLTKTVSHAQDPTQMGFA